MGAMEPLRDHPGHELCVVVQGVAANPRDGRGGDDDRHAAAVHARLAEVKGTAGGVSFLLLDEALPASPACIWTLNHTVALDDPLQLFPLHSETVG